MRGAPTAPPPTRPGGATSRAGPTPRTGFQHFERVHTVVLRDALACSACHAELSPCQPGHHTIDRLDQSTACRTCHDGEA